MSVEVTLPSSLATGGAPRRTYVAVPEGAMLRAVLDRLVDRYGRDLGAALRDGAELAADAGAVRVGNVAEERLTMDSRIEPGDRIRFERAVPEPAHSASEFSA
jgi:allophanate hydrolase subunit 2